MKATVDVPDELYRRVKAKSALQGRTIREVTTELYRQWLAEEAAARPGQPPEKWVAEWVQLGEETLSDAPSGPHRVRNPGSGPQPTRATQALITLDANVWIAAYDPSDHFHAQSVALLSELARRRVPLYGPAFVLVESACASARRAQDPSIGEAVQARLRAHPLLTLHPLDEELLTAAAELGSRRLLRGADTLYAAAALLRGTPLISWDGELIAAPAP